MKYTNWVIPTEEGTPPAGLPPLVGRVLAARGFSEADAAEFLRTDAGLLNDPLLMKDMDKAVRRVEQALRTGETFAVYGDYDVDGMTAACLLYDFFTRRGGNVLRYIPRRLSEGYGLNKAALQTLRDRGCTLVVTVDCGITAVEEAEFAASIGLELVITDHHTCKDPLPRCAAVVDPQRPDCPYPFKGLAGVGVALKLAMAMGCPLEEYVDYAALGTVADVMPLVGENRAIVSLGLARMPQRPGLAALMEEAAVDPEDMNATALSYTLCPRRNAAGRLGVTQAAEELLLARDREMAGALAEELGRLNRERQRLEGEIFDRCVTELGRDPALAEGDALVLGGEGWHQGVVGIVASRLAERYDKPAFIISLDGGMGKGSCRSAGGVSLFRALEGCAQALEGFGGHDMAAGFTVREENIPLLRRLLCDWVAEHRTATGGPTLQVDCELDDPGLLSLENVEAMGLLEPFGAGNPRPVFVLSDCEAESMTRVGDQGRHLRFSIRKEGQSLGGIFFSYPQRGEDFREWDRVDVAFTPQINRFHGRSSVQLVAADLRQGVGVYDRYRRGEELTRREVLSLIPSREDFAWVWRYLRSQAPLYLEGRVTGPVSHARTMVSLEVFEERGLIWLTREEHRVSVVLRPTEGKVDLEESPIMRTLRGLAEGD